MALTARLSYSLFSVFSLFRIDVELSVKWSIPIVFSIMGLNFYVSSLIPRYSGAALFFVSIMAANSSFSFILLTIITKLGSKPKTD